MKKNMSKHIFLIPSYPKSGNTLLRIIISSLFFSKDGKTNLKKILIDQLEDTKYLNLIKSINSKDFLKLGDLNTLYKYQLKIKEKHNFSFNEDFSFFKTHHAFINFHNHPYITENFLRGYIYLIRDPRDIVLSWANHTNTSIEKSIEFVMSAEACINWTIDKNSKFPQNIQPKVLISDWQNHVNSWISNNLNVPRMIIKYEDLITSKEKIILDIVNFFKKNFGIEILNLDQKIRNIIETTDFNYLKKKEDTEGFEERVCGKFFNKGKSNQWKKKLTNKQQNIIEKKFFKTISSLGYEHAVK